MLLTTLEVAKMLPEFDLEKDAEAHADLLRRDGQYDEDRMEWYIETYWSNRQRNVVTLIHRSEIKGYFKRGRWYIPPRSIKRYLLRREARERYKRDVLQAQYEAQREKQLMAFTDFGGDEQFFDQAEWGLWFPGMVTEIFEGGGTRLRIPLDKVDYLTRNLRAAIRSELFDSDTVEYLMESLRYSITTVSSEVDALELDIQRQLKRNLS